MMQWHSYTTGAPLVVPKPTPFCTGTVGLTLVSFPDDFSFGRMKSLACETSLMWCLWADHAASANITHTALFSHLDGHTVYTTAINS